MQAIRLNGRFANPWPNARPSGTFSHILRWQWQRLRNGVPPAPAVDAFEQCQPAIVQPTASPAETRISWLGQSGFLLQLGGLNLLVDPVLSRRASPFAHVGPSRIVPSALTVAELPPLHALVLSHDHYDHLDERTCAALLERFGALLPIFAPLGYRAWFARLGALAVTELDWWQTASIADLELTCLPVQHWSRRGRVANTRLWGAWLLCSHSARVYFCGDSGYCPAFREVYTRLGAPDVALLPIGAYEPRWFMRTMHMNPEEAVQAYLDLSARDFVAMHWGTFHLTDEPMLEPPERLRAEWRARGLPEAQLHIPRHGETLVWKKDAEGHLASSARNASP
jgi:N-acyl-phosphatidylethanolamine-hydrolysing phospholipase D